MKNVYDINEVNRLFIQQSYKDNWDMYSASLKTITTDCWDYLIITASNEWQGEAYRIQIEERQKKGLIPKGMKCIIISDPDGKRVGSGGATLNVLSEIYEYEHFNLESFSKLRVLVIHSGGDSKRVPQYSAIGKLFSPVPHELPDGRASTLFEELIIAFSGLPTRMESGVMIVAGDILTLFNHMQADLMRDGVVGLTIKAFAKQGSNHGVFCVDKSGRVRKFLHKVPVERLRSEGAINAIGTVDIDTGAFWLSSKVTKDILMLVCDNGQKIDKAKFNTFVNERIRLSLYADFIIPMTSQADLEEYLCEPSEGVDRIDLENCRKKIWEALHIHKLYVQRFSPAEFIHFGTTHELREIMSGAKHFHNHLGWTNTVASTGGNDKYTSINSVICLKATIGNDSFIENSIIADGSKIGVGSIISGCAIDNRINVAQDTVLQLLPVSVDNQQGYVARIYGVRDNPKDEIRQNASFLGSSLEEWMSKNYIKSHELWDIENYSLWDAKLYPVCKTAEEAILWAEKLQNSVATKSKIDKNEWVNMNRMSLHSSFRNTNISEVVMQMNEISDKVSIICFKQAVFSGKCCKESNEHLGKGDIAVRRVKKILKEISEIKGSQMSSKIRIYRALSELVKSLNIKQPGLEAQVLEDLCFAEVNRAICSVTVDKVCEEKQLRIIKDNVEISLPVRVNTGGEWTDTPPYSLEFGGTVLNIAITINGNLPIRARSGKINLPVIRLSSIDLNIQRDFYSIDELLKYDNPSDPFALHKAALVVSGILPIRENVENMTMEKVIDMLGGGLYLETSVLGIPKGSGLGTSSILASAAVMAIRELVGAPYDKQELFRRVLALEQLMTTGGGWQDQVGGIVPGIKLLTSQPGINQTIVTHKIDVSEKTQSELNSRLILIYSGQRRLAKSILRNIMGRYILNDKEAIGLLHEIQRLAVLMKFELEKGDIDSFARLMTVHKDAIKKLDPGSSNTCIDLIIKVAEPFLSGVMFCGAAGGGFLVAVLKDASMKKILSETLCDVFQDTEVGLWNCEIFNC